MASMASANNMVMGTFAGNNKSVVAIACPFNPDIALAWCDELTTNPGLSGGGLVSVYINKNMSTFNTLRYTSETSAITVGGARRELTTNYADGIFSLNSQSTGTAFSFLEGYTYKYVLIKL